MGSNPDAPEPWAGFDPDAPPGVAATSSVGTSTLAARGDHTHEGVASFNAAVGAVTYSPTLHVAAPANLAAIVTLGASGYQNGQMAFVAAMRAAAGPGLYILQDAVSSAPDSYFVIATADDPTRQWVHQSVQEAGFLQATTGEINLTVPQTIQLIPPLNYIGSVLNGLSWLTTQKDGTVTTGPTAQGGTDAGISNLAASTVNAGLAGTAINGRTFLAGAPVTTNNKDLSAFGVRVQITAGAVLGTATVFKARLLFGPTINRF